MPLLITESDVEHLLTVKEALDLVESAFVAFGEGKASNSSRQRVRSASGVLHVMAAGDFERGYFGYKAYNSFGGRTRFYFHLFDATSGDYLAIFQADRLGQIRTGAASGVATRYLAREDANRVGLIGTGWQAESQLEAICAVRKINCVRCYSRTAERRESFAQRMTHRLGIEVIPVPTAREAAASSDILVTVTSSAEPVLQGEWLEPGTHINAVGGNWAHRRELDNAAVRNASAIFVDSVEQAKIEAGDLIIPIAQGILGWQQVQELGMLITGRARGRTSSKEITLFKSCGIALEDVAVGAFVYERARRERVGQSFDFNDR